MAQEVARARPLLSGRRLSLLGVIADAPSLDAAIMAQPQLSRNSRGPSRDSRRYSCLSFSIGAFIYTVFVERAAYEYNGSGTLAKSGGKLSERVFTQPRPITANDERTLNAASR